ncbi:unnamed protein product [Laminaria digitata]
MRRLRIHNNRAMNKLFLPVLTALFIRYAARYTYAIISYLVHSRVLFVCCRSSFDFLLPFVTQYRRMALHATRGCSCNIQSTTRIPKRFWDLFLLTRNDGVLSKVVIWKV